MTELWAAGNWQERLAALPELDDAQKGRACAIILAMDRDDRELAVPRASMESAVRCLLLRRELTRPAPAPVGGASAHGARRKLKQD